MPMTKPSVLTRRAVRLACTGVVLAALSAIPAMLPFGSGAHAQNARTPYTLIESGRSFAALQEAVNAIGDGTGTIRIAPGVYRDCAVQQAGDVGFVAQVPGQTVFDGAACEGKAAIVARGRATRVEGLIFQNIRVPDANGSGIRLEHGNLTVRQSWFRDSEQGILSADDPAGPRIDIDDDDLRAVHEFQRIEHPAGIELRPAEIGHAAVGRTRFDFGDQPVERDHLPLRRGFAQIVLVTIAAGERGRARGEQRSGCKGYGQNAEHAHGPSANALNRR